MWFFSQELLISSSHMDCNLVSFSNLHLLEQLCQDSSFPLDCGKIKFICPAEEFIVVTADLLYRGPIIIVLQ